VVDAAVDHSVSFHGHADSLVVELRLKRPQPEDVAAAAPVAAGAASHLTAAAGSARSVTG
jgi:hypothetical protein